MTKNISVSGFFDHQNPRRNILLITRKLVGYADKMTMGVIVMTNPDPERLLERTDNILQHLVYTGPFELEFFYEEKDHTYYVLELNARFWMQHGIFVSFFENGLIKRYLGMDTERDWNNLPSNDRPLIWVDNLAFLSSLLLLRTRIVRALLKNIRKGVQVCFYPGFSVFLGYVVRVGLRRLRQCDFFSRRGNK
ncbi:MAG: ATP-binding protein [Thermodesulfobacteriota bacterium]